MLTVHRALGTWNRAVDLFIAPSEFARQKFVDGGLAADKIIVKPHFVHVVPGARHTAGTYALSVGRLSPEKGIDTLLRAWGYLNSRLPLKILGSGPLDAHVAAATRSTPGIEWFGWQPKDRVEDAMREARFLIFPSVCYETFGLTIAEAFGVGLPVISSDIGSMSTLIAHRKTGLLFRAGDVEDLVAQVEWGLAHPDVMMEISQRAHLQYEERYTAERNYQVLIEAYATAIDAARERRGTPTI
jgi:glycosyltransferase involved in cell wall biosynthesis